MASKLYASEVPADATNLRITEFHYHPANPTPTELAVAPGAEDNSFEFIELVNVSNFTVDLAGVKFTSGVNFAFDDGNIHLLAPGETVLVVSNITAFQARYGSGLPVAGAFSGQLSNSGERLALADASDEVIFDFTFLDSSPWPTSPDGDGPSLQVIDPFGNLNNGANWRASENVGGNPGISGLAIPGDYDKNGSVGNSDYAVWQNQFGASMTPAGAGADGNKDGWVNAADFVFWRDRLSAGGTSVGSGSAAFVGAGSEIADSTSTVSDPPPFAEAFSSDRTWRIPNSKSGSGFASSQVPDSNDRLLLLLANDRVRRASEETDPEIRHSDVEIYSDAPTKTSNVDALLISDLLADLN